MGLVALILAAFFAMNMGGSGMSPAFAAGYGAGIITRKKAALLFGIFVLLGAYIAGDKVVNTISRGIVSEGFIDIKVTLVVLLSAAVSLFIANMLKVAVSTSSVTVFSLISVGLYFKQLYILMLLRIFSFWLARISYHTALVGDCGYLLQIDTESSCPLGYRIESYLCNNHSLCFSLSCKTRSYRTRTWQRPRPRPGTM